MKLRYENLNGISHEDWLKRRKQGIGGSDAAAIVGLNKYVSLYTLWADKTGRLPEQKDNEAMRQGRDFEEYVVQRFTESTGKKAQRVNSTIYCDKYPFAYVHPDRKIVGERAGLECKTTSIMNLSKFKNGEFPDTYYVQCVHGLAVTGWNRWYLAVLVLNQGFYLFTIERDEEEIQALMQAERDFWDTYVFADVMPPVDGSLPTSQALSAIFKGGNDEIKRVYKDEIISNYLEIKRQISALETEKEKCEQIIKQELGDAEKGECANYDIIWRSQSRKTIDTNLIRKDYPDINLSNYYKTSNYRLFNIKERK